MHEHLTVSQQPIQNRYIFKTALQLFLVMQLMGWRVFSVFVISVCKTRYNAVWSRNMLCKSISNNHRIQYKIVQGWKIKWLFYFWQIKILFYSESILCRTNFPWKVSSLLKVFSPSFAHVDTCSAHSSRHLASSNFLPTLTSLLYPC